MKFPKLFGNRKARRTAEKRGAPTLEELPDDLRAHIIGARNAATTVDVLRKGVYEGVKASVVHDAISWLTNMAQYHDACVRSHPEFATFFPKEALQLAQAEAVAEASKPPLLVAPNGDKLA